MQRIDIRPLKNAMRQEIKQWRRELSSEKKARMDERICARIAGLREYAACGTVLTYISTPIEVETLRLIDHALGDGKRVAAPRCVEGTRRMEFYLIRSLDDLAPGSFGVLEPIPARCSLWRDEGDSICIVPALAYDRRGFRLGYGAGYYDRFLSSYRHAKIGVVYQHNLHGRLWSGKYDVPVDLVVTENRLWKVATKTPRSSAEKNRPRTK